MAYKGQKGFKLNELVEPGHSEWGLLSQAQEEPEGLACYTEKNLGLSTQGEIPAVPVGMHDLTDLKSWLCHWLGSRRCQHEEAFCLS